MTNLIFLIGSDRQAIELFPRYVGSEYWEMWFTECEFLNVLNKNAHPIFYYPEARLSPIQQLEWGDFLVQYAKNYSHCLQKIFVVTHSQNIILRVRNLVSKNKFNADDCLIKYFHNSQIVDIQIKDDGSLTKGLPMSWFGADIIEFLSFGEKET